MTLFYSIVIFSFVTYKLVSCGQVSITAYGKRLVRNIDETLDLKGLKQCIRECERRGRCKAVNHCRTNLQCELLRESITNISELEENDSYVFVDMDLQTTVCIH